MNGLVTISWFDCDCDWATKYCSENHRRTAKVSREALQKLISKADWEYMGVPILEDGTEWAKRPVAECQELIREHADPEHWIHEPHNDDLAPVVDYRVVRRYPAGEWEDV